MAMPKPQGDLWGEINKQLALADKFSADESDTPWLDETKALMDFAQRERILREEREEKRNERFMGIMNMTAGDYETSSDNASINANIERINNYYNKNKDKFNEHTIDYFDALKGQMKNRVALNTDFLSYQERLPSKVAEVNEYLKTIDRDKGFNAENIEELKKMQKPLVDFMSEFQMKHGDRLQSAAYQTYNMELQNMRQTNKYLIQSAGDDGFLKDNEIEAYMKNMELGNTDASDILEAREKDAVTKQSDQLVTKMNNEISELEQIQKFLDGEGILNFDQDNNYDPEGEQSMSLKDLLTDDKGDPRTDDERDIILSEWYLRLNNKIDKANKFDRSFQELSGIGSYIEDIDQSILKKRGLGKQKGEGSEGGEGGKQGINLGAGKVIKDLKKEDQQTYTSTPINSKEDAENHLIQYIKGEISEESLRKAGGQNLVNKANRIKNRYKGETPTGRKIYKGKPISDIEILKQSSYGKGRLKHTWDDVVSDISKNKDKFITNTIATSLADEFLNYNDNIDSFLKDKNIKLRYKKRRTTVDKFKKEFKKTGLSIEEYKVKYPKKYKNLKNILGLIRK